MYWRSGLDLPSCFEQNFWEEGDALEKELLGKKEPEFGDWKTLRPSMLQNMRKLILRRMLRYANTINNLEEMVIS